MCEQWGLHCASQWGREIPLSEHVYCHIQNNWVSKICIKFCVQLEHSSAEAIRMIQMAFGYDAISAVQIKVWHKHFKDGRECVESDPRSGRPATSRTPENVECVQAAIHKDQQLTVWELEADLGIPKTTVSEILTQDLGMKHAMAKFVLHLLMTWFKPLPMNQISSRRS